MNKTIGIIGLGLIGGSMARAIKANTGNTVFGYDINENVLTQAIAQNAIDKIIKEDEFCKCDNILVALYPNDTIEFVKKNIDKFKKGTIIIDCAGVKSNICKSLSEFVNGRGLYFIGGHPMMGIEKSGFENSFAHLFDGATMILCKDEFTNIIALKAAEMFFTSIGFLKITITTADEHDRIIAFTSQLAHIVANAYIKSDSAKMQVGFSAGSYKDMTRVAYLNENMWTELFLENKNYLTAEIDLLIAQLGEYSAALKKHDEMELKKLLVEGKNAKMANG
ncbi:MAG: prephenate dehydrogenase [Oscillospiraceae bacterium]|nr:prephenate dehydrogenase [Oscillospiraceae bacterium]